MAREATNDLPLWGDGSEPLEVRYRRWRDTVDGQDVFQRIERAALDLLHAGAQRIEINLLYAQIRQVRRKSADNSYRALIARDLIAKHPRLTGIIRIKKRKAEAA